jgi:hypothetical protein
VINPSLLVDKLVDALRDCPEVVRNVGNDPMRIKKYTDNPPYSSSLSRGIYLAETPSVLIAYQGTAIGPNGEVTHNFSLYLRARDAEDPSIPTFADLVTSIFNATPATGDGLRLIDMELTDDVLPIEPPATDRIHDEEGRLDIFQMVTSITEKWDNFGNEVSNRR